MKKNYLLKKTSVAIALMLTISNCGGNVRQSLGIYKSEPDAFRVVSTPPLTLPPDFSLKMPEPGASPLNSVNITKEAENTVFSNSSGNIEKKAISSGDQEFLMQAGADKSDSNIRTILANDERAQEEKKEKKNIFEKMADHLNPNSTDQDAVVNASKEKKRVDKNKQLGKEVNEGTVPVVDKDKRDKGFINRVLGL